MSNTVSRSDRLSASTIQVSIHAPVQLVLRQQCWNSLHPPLRNACANFHFQEKLEGTPKAPAIGSLRATIGSDRVMVAISLKKTERARELVGNVRETSEVVRGPLNLQIKNGSEQAM